MLEVLKQFFELLWRETTPFVIIHHYENGIRLRFGKYKSVLDPGLHFKIPFVDEVLTAHNKLDTIQVNPISITTLDNKTISIGVVLEIVVVDIKRYLIEANSARESIMELSRGITSDYLEECTWEDIKKKKTINALTRLVSAKCCEFGVELKSIMFTDKCTSRVLKLFSDTHKLPDA